ncbi:MAG: bifunctional metallophosphatase/5'-nucleotidase, partial [Myxococcota bacterium]
MNAWLRRWGLSGILVISMGCSGATEVREPLSDDGLAAAGRCLILTTNDAEANFDGPKVNVDGQMSYQGSISRIAAEKKRLLAQHPGSVLLISAGDDLQGRYMERADGNRALAAKTAWQVYEKAGYDYGTLGNHEFDAGPAVVRAALEGLSTYRILVANVDLPGSILDRPGAPLIKEQVVADCGGLRVGLFGLLTPSAKQISDIGDLKFKNPDDPVFPAARAAIARLKQQGAQVIVVISHLGIEGDMKLAEHVQGIDAIIGGHSHSRQWRWERFEQTVVVQSGERFKHLGYLELVGKANGKPGMDLPRSSWLIREVKTDMPRDEATEQAITAAREPLIQERVVGQRTVPWDVSGAKSDYGQRAARAVQHFAQEKSGKPVVAGLLNSGGLRSNTVYPVGPVTNLEIAAIHPFQNHLVLVELTGEQLAQAFDSSCGGTVGNGGNERRPSRAVVFGLDVQCLPDNPGIKYRYEDNKPVQILQPGQRVVSIAVDGKPVDPKALYRLATLDYLTKAGTYYALGGTARKCLDGRDYTEEDPCKGSPLLAEVIESAVVDGTMDQPLAP